MLFNIIVSWLTSPRRLSNISLVILRYLKWLSGSDSLISWRSWWYSPCLGRRSKILRARIPLVRLINRLRLLRLNNSTRIIASSSRTDILDLAREMLGMVFKAKVHDVRTSYRHHYLIYEPCRRNVDEMLTKSWKVTKRNAGLASYY